MSNLLEESSWFEPAPNHHVQTRSEQTGLQKHDSLDDALNHALADRSIWKISYITVQASRARYIREGTSDVFYNTPIIL